MLQGNQVGSYTPAHKGLIEYLNDQVMAQLSSPSGDTSATAPDTDQAAESEPAESSGAIFFTASRPSCTCPRCAVLRHLL